MTTGAIREMLAQSELLRLLGDDRPWTKVALQHAASFSESMVDKMLRELERNHLVSKAQERCECCGHSIVRYRRVLL